MSLFLFGGQVLNGFSFALVVGIIVGTYSSVFIASPILVFWQNFLDSRGSKAPVPPVDAGKRSSAADGRELARRCGRMSDKRRRGKEGIMAMFEQTFVDGMGKTNKGWTVLVSFGVQFVIIGVLILIPLIYTDVLPQAQLTSMSDGAAAASSASSASASAPVVKIVKVAPRQFDAGRLMAPKEIPKNVAIIRKTICRLPMAWRRGRRRPRRRSRRSGWFRRTRSALRRRLLRLLRWKLRSR